MLYTWTELYLLFDMLLLCSLHRAVHINYDTVNPSKFLIFDGTQCTDHPPPAPSLRTDNFYFQPLG